MSSQRLASGQTASFQNRLWKFFLLCLLIVSPLAEASVFEGHSTKKVLENGLTVLVTEMPAAPVVSVFALVKTGSATEGELLGSGVSHFLEHMLFKGTAKRKVGEIAAEIQAVGGTINASTGKDYTIYTITVPPEAFDAALDVLSDMLMNSAFDAEELGKEREVVFNEMRLHDDNPDRYLSGLVSRNIYLLHPYRHPIIGYEALLKKLSRKDFLKYYHARCTANNTIVSVAGRIQTEEILPKIREAFKDYRQGPYLPRNLPEEPPQISPRRYEEEYPTQLTRFSLTFPTVSLLHPDLFALDVLAKVLGQGHSSRLYLEMVQKKELVYGISSYNYTPADRGFFGVDAVLEEVDVQDAIACVLAEIEKTKDKGIRLDELDKAKRQVLSEHILGMQRTSSVAYAQATDESYTGDYRFSEKYVEGIRRVTVKEVQAAAKKYLDPGVLSVTILKPEKDKEESAPAEETDKLTVTQGLIKKFVLDNGMTVLLRRDPAFPAVSIRLALNGGLRQEDPRFNGVSNLAAEMWLKGTRSYSAEKIAEMTESLGLRAGAFSGKNSFGLSMEFLSEDLDQALHLLEELIKYPTFPDDQLGLVKEQVLAAIKQNDDSISHVTGQALKEALFLKHPYRLPETGTADSISRIDRERILKFYGSLVSPSNMVLSVFGDIAPEAVLKSIKKRFDSLEPFDVHLSKHVSEDLTGPRKNELFLDKEQAMVMFGFPGPDIRNPDRYGLDVLTSILGSSFSGRLFSRIREELGKAYTLGAEVIPGPDAGYIYFYALTEEEHLAEVQKILRETIAAVRAKNVPGEELEAMKTYLKGTFAQSLQTNASLSFSSSLDELYGLGFDHYLDYDQKIDAVTPEDLRRLAQGYLDLNKMAVVVTHSQKEND